LFFNFKSLIFYSEISDAARILAADSNALGNISIGGGYSLAYANTLISIFVFDVILNRNIKSKTIKLILFLFLLISIYVVLKTKSTLTIIWLSFGLILTFFSKRAKNKVRRKSSSPLVFIITTIILIFVFHKNIGYFLIDNFRDNDVISMRLSELGRSLSSGIEASEYSEYRLSRYITSISSFFDSILIGNGYKYGYIYKDSLPYMGGHSEWLDALANYGLIGIIPLFLFFYNSLKNNPLITNKRISTSIIIVFILLGTFNPLISFHSMLVVLLIVPTFSNFIHSSLTHTKDS
jgi:O-antigen ligase